jgi:hypothetical protein
MAEMRPRFSSGASNCTSEWRTTTLTLSTAPQMTIIRNAIQNQTVLGMAWPKQF